MLTRASNLVLTILLFLVFAVQANGGPQGAKQSTTSAEAEARIAALENRLKTIEDKYTQAVGFHDTEYVLKLEKQYESYYEKAFNSQTTTIWGLGIILTVLLALAGRFGFQIFDRQIEFTIKSVASELRAAFDAKLRDELLTLERKSNEQVSKALEDLSANIKLALEKMTIAAEIHRKAGQGLIFASLKQFEEAVESHHDALKMYSSNKESKVITITQAAAITKNLFVALYNSNPGKFNNLADNEIKSELFRMLREELIQAAADFPQLIPLLAEADKK